MKRNNGIIGPKQVTTTSSAIGTFDLFDQYNIKTDDNWPPTQKVLSISNNNGTNLNENVINTFTVTTKGFNEGDTIYYSIATVSGPALTGADFSSGSLTGSFSLSSGNGTFIITPLGDGVAENNTCKIEIRRDSVSGSIMGESAVLTITDADPPIVGQNDYTTAGQDTFTVPTGVTSVHFVLIGGGGGGATSTQSSNGVSGGGGGGGGLSWRNNYSVSAGDVLYITVGALGTAAGAAGQNTNSAGGDSYIRLTSHSGTIIGRAGGGGKGEYNNAVVVQNGGTNYSATYGGGGSNSGGGTGGRGGRGKSGNAGGGGGGAGGYAGNGGIGNDSNVTTDRNAPAGGGGGGSAALNAFTSNVVIGGGGVDILGQGTSGNGGTNNNSSSANGGYQGSTGGPSGSGNSTITKTYGGGGSGCEDDSGGASGPGGVGAVRIIWGAGRAYPSTNTTDQ